MLTPIINFLTARGMSVSQRSERVLHITTIDNNRWFLTVDRESANVMSDGRILITHNFLRDAQALDIAKERAFRLFAKGLR